MGEKDQSILEIQNESRGPRRERRRKCLPSDSDPSNAARTSERNGGKRKEGRPVDKWNEEPSGTNALDAPSILCHEPICLPLCIIHKVHPLACPACYCPMPSFPPFRLRFPPPPPPPPPPPSILPFRPRELARPQFRPHILSPHIPFPPLPPLPPGVHLLPFPRLHNLISRKSNINPEVKM